jgi:hypothetical protein
MGIPPFYLIIVFSISYSELASKEKLSHQRFARAEINRRERKENGTIFHQAPS